jgi:hypothetical protein
MARLMRKNLMADGERVRELARRRGTSESAAVRQAVECVLAADEVVAAFDELAARGGVDDVFGKTVHEDDDEEAAGAAGSAFDGGAGDGGAGGGDTPWPALKSPTRAS